MLNPSKDQVRQEMLETVFLMREGIFGDPKFSLSQYARVRDIILCRPPLP